ncbi:hypothetical protein [Croceitalea sp. P059]|uniref:hypothetical protein n=1 Tax=Croceitalea sp. P059 TaxID=3075601 RepID=UPI002885A4C5|nr:hypothetical protein [Croceitalea sp. P059]MDT0539722.1 hypothetical protein [Croceitalea sp. P059]
MILSFNQRVKSQNSYTYYGPLSIGNYSGDASYGFTVISGDTLLNGPFQIKKANLDDLLQKQDYSFDFSGNFKNNYPNGDWKFKFGTFQSNNQSQVVDYQYRVAISGVQEEAFGEMVDGKPNGPWVFSVNKIKDSEISERLFKSNIIFDNGIPKQNFRIENDSLILAGRFLRNGLAHDEWSLYDSFGFGAAENWIFSNGVLKQIVLSIDGTNTKTSIYGNYSGNTTTINLDSQFIDAIALFQFAKSKADDVVGGKMQGLLKQNGAYYQKIDNILSELGKSSFLPEFKVKVPYYEFSNEERELLNSISSNYTNAATISTNFLEDTRLNILKLSNEDAAFQYEVINQITKNFLKPIKRLLDYKNREILEFAPRKELIDNLWPQGEPITVIDVVFEIDEKEIIKTYEFPTTDKFNFSEHSLKSVESISTYALKSLSSIKVQLEQTLLKEQREQELVTIEEQLIFQRNSLQNQIDSALNISPNNIKSVLNTFKEHSDTALSDYSSLKDLETKLNAGKVLLDCYLQLHMLTNQITLLPEQEEAIQLKYQDRIWNPFMATLMDEEVKKRITTAYKKTVVPYFLRQAKSEFKCNQAKELNVLMKATYQRMLELRDQNTSKLERKLRKENDPNTVLELFELEPLTIE